MIGWEKVPPIAGGHEDVERCTGPLCGALVRRSDAGRREQHDREFHVDDKPTAIAEHDLRKRLGLGPDEGVPAGRYEGLWGAVLDEGQRLVVDERPLLTSATYEATLTAESTIARDEVLRLFGFEPHERQVLLMSMTATHEVPSAVKPRKRKGLTGKRYRIAKRRYARAVRDWRRGRTPGVKVVTHLPRVRMTGATAVTGKNIHHLRLDAAIPTER